MGNTQLAARWRGAGLRDVTDPPSQEILQAVDDQVRNRFRRVNELLQFGESYWLSLDLGIASPAPAAGTQNIIITPNQDFDLLIIGANCNRYLSKIEIVDSARNRLLTNGATILSSICSTPGANGAIQPIFEWHRPYLLPARSQLRITVTADGTETGGSLTFLCLQPPTSQW